MQGTPSYKLDAQATTAYWLGKTVNIGYWNRYTQLIITKILFDFCRAKILRKI